MKDAQIYKRIIVVMISVYIIITSVISAAMLISRKNIAENGVRQRISQADIMIQQISHSNTSQNNIENIKQNIDTTTLNSMLSYCGIEAAVFDDNCNLIAATNREWSALHENADGTFTTVSFSPNEYLNKQDIEKAAEKFSYSSSSNTAGDISSFSLKVTGNITDDNKIIPLSIYTEKNIIKKSGQSYGQNFISTYAEPDTSFAVINNSTPDDNPVTETIDNIGVTVLPYSGYSKLRCGEEQTDIRKFVSDSERLKKILNARNEKSSAMDAQDKKYNYTLSSYKSDSGDGFHIAYAYKYNVITDSIPLLLFIWICSLSVFLTASLILISGIRSNIKQRNELDKKRQYLTNALAHDLKSPLSVISGCTQNINENVMPEKHDQYIRTITQQTDKMSNIISEMLNMSKTDEAKLSIRRFSLKDLSLKIWSEYEITARNNDINFIIEGDSSINADKNLISSVIDNFLTNALKFTNKGGCIKINITPGRFEVYNSGSSVPDDMIKKIWDAYTMADNSRNSKSGTGLGLYIAASALKKHNFQYGASNINNGFSIWFEF